MVKLLNISDLSLISHLEEEVQAYALEALSILDEAYGTEIDLTSDHGGYLAIVEHQDEIEELEKLHNYDLTKNPYTVYVDNNYTYCIEKIYVKKLKRFEIRFSLYKDITGHPEK